MVFSFISLSPNHYLPSYPQESQPQQCLCIETPLWGNCIHRPTLSTALSNSICKCLYFLSPYSANRLLFKIKLQQTQNLFLRSTNYLREVKFSALETSNKKEKIQWERQVSLEPLGTILPTQVLRIDQHRKAE